jgi:hypothetical protein
MDHGMMPHIDDVDHGDHMMSSPNQCLNYSSTRNYLFLKFQKQTSINIQQHTSTKLIDGLTYLVTTRIHMQIIYI